MRLGAVHLAKKLQDLRNRPDALLVSDYTNLPAVLGLCSENRRPVTALYFLENQLTYPIRTDSMRDLEFMAMNFLSCLAADRCIFCSHNQMHAMFDAPPKFLSHNPELDVRAEMIEIEKKSTVIPIGINLRQFDQARNARPVRAGKPLRVVWPHRFEHDKNPDDFFRILVDLAEEELPFEVSVLGQSYKDVPLSILEAHRRLGYRIVAWGHREGDEYAKELAASDVVVSTAFHETQGVAVIEAIRAGCDPLLPDRLSYPEALGPRLAGKHLYKSKGDLRRRLRWMMRHPVRVRATSDHWREMERFGWTSIGPAFGGLVRTMVENKGSARP